MSSGSRACRQLAHAFALLLALALPGTASAYRLDPQLYNRADGLPDLQPTVGLQDRDGFLWIGTLGGGLARFDGRSFHVFARTEFRGGMVTSLVEGDGAVWIGSNAGLTRYDGAFRTWDRRHGLRSSFVTALAFYRSRLLVGTERGLFELAGDVLRPTSFPLPTGRIDSLLAASDGALWVIADLTRLFRLSPAGWQEMGAAEGVPSLQLYNLVEYEGDLLLCTAAGVRRLVAGRWGAPQWPELATEYARAPVVGRHGELWLARLYGAAVVRAGEVRMLGPSEGIPNLFTKPLLLDREGNLWLSADGAGLLRLSAQAPLRFDPFPKNRGPVWSVARDGEGGVWAASPEGLARRPPPGDGGRDALGYSTSDRQPFVPRIEGEPIYSILVRRDGSVWCAGRAWVARCSEPGAARIPVRVRLGELIPTQMAESRDGALWLAGPYGAGELREGQLREVVFAGRAFSPRVNAIVATPDGTVWIAARTGFFRFRPDRDRQAQPVRPELDDDMLQTMIADGDGSLWLGGYNGLVHYRPAVGGAPDQLRRIDAEHGLLGNNVIAIAHDRRDGLLVATQDGLDRLDLAQYRRGRVHVQRMSVHRPAAWSGVWTNAVLAEPGDRLWLGTTSGLARFDLGNAVARVPPPSAQLASVHLFDRELVWRRRGAEARSTSVTLAPGENHLTFRFDTPFLGVASQVGHRYRLAGLEEELSQVAAVGAATYPSVPPGTYRFEVQACVDGRCQPQPTAIDVVVAAPVWQRAWFVATAVSCCVGAGLLATRRRSRLRAEQTRRLELAVQARTADLTESARRMGSLLRQARLEQARAQLEPHFLFNALHGISALMEEDVRLARRMLVRLSNLLRLFLHSGDEHMVTLQEEIFLGEQYLELQQLRFRSRLRVTWCIADDCRDVQVPRLLLQPLLENAVRHGIEPRRGGGTIAIDAARHGDLVRLRVSDDGPGFGTHPRVGVGLANLRSRIEAVYGSAFRVELATASELGGGCVVVELPVRGDELFAYVQAPATAAPLDRTRSA